MNLGQLTRKQSAMLLLDWLNQRFPGIKRAALKNAGANTLGEDDPEDAAWYDKVIDAASALVPAYYNYKTQAKIVDAQIERARAGQPPLDARQYAAPPIVVEHAVAPGAISSGLAQEDKNMLWIGAGLVGVLLFMNMRSAND